ncbi:MAG: serine/threonine protein kinase [Planctomycetaceae bacterium]|nr:serine/threonine protein kinase [Planctomycetaceae bacterium]
MSTDDLNQLYNLFDRLLDLNNEQRQAKLEEMRVSGSPFVSQLESLLGFEDQTEDSTDSVLGRLSEKLPLEQWLQAPVEPSFSIKQPSDLRDLVGLFRWDQNSKQFYAGDYRIGKCLAFNSHSATYFAEDNVLGRRAVVTFAFPSYLKLGDNREQFLESARVVSEIAHPNVATILGVVQQGKLLGIARQWIPGHDLAQWLRATKAVAYSDIAIILQRIVEGLAAIHRCSALHGDLKPANIIMRDDQTIPVITDFGTVFSVEKPRHTSTVWRGGTPGYIAPEVLENKPLDARFDLFSVGKILDQLLSVADHTQLSELQVSLQNLRDELQAADPAQRPDNCDAVLQRLLPLTGIPITDLPLTKTQAFSPTQRFIRHPWTRRSFLTASATLLPFMAGRSFHHQQFLALERKRIFIPGTEADVVSLLSFKKQTNEFDWALNGQPAPFSWECADSTVDFPQGGLCYLKTGLNVGQLLSEPIALSERQVRYNTLIVWAYFNAPPGSATCRVDVRTVPRNKHEPYGNWRECVKRSNYFGGAVRRNLVGTIEQPIVAPQSALQFRITFEVDRAWSGTGQPPLVLQIESYQESLASIGQFAAWFSEEA